MTRALLVAGLCLSLPAFGRAGSIYSNLGPDNSYNSTSGFTIGNPGTPPGFNGAPAFAFTPEGSYDLTEIDVPVFWISGTNSITLNLLGDSNGQPGGLIESWTLTNLPFNPFDTALQSVSPTRVVPLISGLQYWVQIAPGDASTLEEWSSNLTGPGGPSYYTNNGEAISISGYPTSAFQVLGTPVPEPRFVWLPGTCLIFGLILWRRRLDRQRS